MPKITHIIQQKDKDRANIYLDGKFAFGITLESLLQNHLKVGQELSDEHLSVLKSQSGQDKIFVQALRFVVSRPHSEREVNLWFKRKKVSPEQSKGAFARLKKLGLVDDEKFASWWIEQRTVFRPKPKQVLRQELRARGITDEVFENAFVDTETISDLEIAKKITEKRWQRLKVLPKKAAKQKLLQYLAGRGFSYEVARQAIDEVEGK